jgi:dephospho-CoA kinase
MAWQALMTTADKKFIIGLTGNIATGKSVVRKMLEHLGAYGIDADALSHRVIEKGAPGYQPVVEHFGKFILDDDGNIDRAKLGALVFSDPSALKKLEEIIHPNVRLAVTHLIKKSPHKVVVVEAIKLLESSLRNQVDTVWVTVASEANQLARLAKHRRMNDDEAKIRMANQSPQKEKTAAASIVIDNDHTIEDTWNQVQEAWQYLFPEDEKTRLAEPSLLPQADGRAADNLVDGQLHVSRARPEQAEDIAMFINRLSEGSKNLTRRDVMAAFGEKAFMILRNRNQMVGVVGWQVENLVARVDEVWLHEKLNLSEALEALIPAIEEASRQLQAEAALVFVPPILAKQTNIWSKLGYQPRTADELSVNAWKEAALETMGEGTHMLFKQLRVDRVLRPL